MKPRKVVLTIEVTTDAPLGQLRTAEIGFENAHTLVWLVPDQVHANVIRDTKRPRDKRKKG